MFKLKCVFKIMFYEINNIGEHTITCETKKKKESYQRVSHVLHLLCLAAKL